MKKFFNNINKLLYKLFDSNVFGVASMCSLFVSAVAFGTGQIIMGAILLGVGTASLGASVYKNIADHKRLQQLQDQEIEEIEFEEYQPQREEVVEVQTYDYDDQASRNNSGEVIK